MNLVNDDYYFLNFPTMDAVRSLEINKDHQVVQGLILGELLVRLGIIEKVYLGKLCKPNKTAYWKLRKVAWSCEELKKLFGDDGVEAVHNIVKGEYEKVLVKSCFVKRLKKDLDEIRVLKFYEQSKKEEVFKKLEIWNGEDIRCYVENIVMTCNNYYRKACSLYMSLVYGGKNARDGFSAPFKPFCDSLSDKVKDEFLSEFNLDLTKITTFSEFMDKMYFGDNLVKLAKNIQVGTKGRNVASLSYDIRELQRRIDLAKNKKDLCYKGRSLQEMECELCSLVAQKDILVSGSDNDFKVGFMSFDVDSQEKKICDYIVACLSSGFKNFVKSKKCHFGYVSNDIGTRFFVVFRVNSPMMKICTNNAENNIFQIFSTLMQAVSDKFETSVNMTRMGKVGFLG